MGKPRNINWYWLAALAISWGFDFLFWQKPPGISFLIWVTAALAGGYVLGLYEKARPALPTLVLTALALGLALIFTARAEGFTQFISVVMALGSLVLLADTYSNANWLGFRLVDYVTGAFRLLVESLARPVVSGKSTVPPGQAADGTLVKQSRFAGVMPVLRGLLIALPVVAVLASLLAASDLIFAARLNDLLKIFDLKKLPEYLVRFCYILIFGYVLTGVYLHALLPRKVQPRPDPQQSWFPRFLGMTESSVVLGAVVALFLFFVILQIRYLFGGEANISETGFTYSDYARRGFFELVAVAVLTLMLYLALNAVTRRDTPSQQAVFTGMSSLLIGLVLVILASALQRLMLYEGAYGFTRLRTYTHVFILWMAALLAAAIILEITRRPGHFALALLVFSYGFTLTIGVMNVDGFIAQQNIQRAVRGFELDPSYLASLSSDAVPDLINAYRDPTQPAAVREGLGGALACQAETFRSRKPVPWQGYNFSSATAAGLLSANQAEWSQYPVSLVKGRGNVVKVNGKEVSCYSNKVFD